ncbi:MAG: hypothetical protein ACKO9B_06275, partial [Planctomycetota bacterium]
KAAFNAISGYGAAQRFEDLERWSAIASGAIRQSRITSNWMNQALGMAIQLMDIAPPAGSAIGSILVDYWPGFIVTLANDQQAPICLLLQSQSGDEKYRESLSKAYKLRQRLIGESVSSFADAVPILRELWPLRMYLHDRGDSLVPVLAHCQLHDLVAEALRDPWRTIESASDDSG